MDIQTYKDSILKRVKTNPEIILEELSSLRKISNQTLEIKEKIWFLIDNKDKGITIH